MVSQATASFLFARGLGHLPSLLFGASGTGTRSNIRKKMDGMR